MASMHRGARPWPGSHGEDYSSGAAVGSALRASMRSAGASTVVASSGRPCASVMVRLIWMKGDAGFGAEVVKFVAAR